MKGKFFFELSLIFLLTGVLVSGAMTQGVLQVNRQGVQILLSCQEDWTGSSWSSCVNGVQNFICFDKNNCNTNNLKPALCGTTQNCTVQSSSSSSSSTGGGGNGGGGNSGNAGTNIASSNAGANICIEQWNCTAWSNANDECGVRICTDAKNCGTTLLKPVTEKSCPGITGGVIGVIGNFAQTPAGIVSITFVVLVFLVALITSSQARLKRMKAQEQARQQETHQKPGQESEEKPSKNKSAQ